MLYDAHIHNQNHEEGGFIIGLEGTPVYEGTLNNDEVLALHDPDDGYIAFYYVSKEECIGNRIEQSYLKYHPRREHYSPDDIIRSIRDSSPRCVIIDTLNEPFWVPYDYWNIAKIFSEIPFVFAHAGGYLINDFVKICHFQPNVWIDFSLTHTILGHYGDERTGLAYIDQAIKYSLHSPFRNRVLLASDYPFYDQDDVFRYYSEYSDLLNENYMCLFKKITEKKIK